MKKLSLIILILCFCQLTVSSQPCMPEGITFYNQLQIDNFQSNNPGCTEIEGSVLIRGDDITNLNGLTVLTSIGGDLILGDYYSGGNPILTSLTGLDSLSYIGGNLSIQEDDTLTSLNGLENLIYLGGDIIIKDNSSLTSLSGLNNLTSILGDLDLSNNSALVDLNGLNALTSIGATLSICGNESLVSLSGLENLHTVHSIEIGALATVGWEIICWSDNTCLESISALNNLTSINGDVRIACNPSLASLTGLENISSISGNLTIANNDTLTSLDGLMNLDTIFGNLYIGIANLWGPLGPSMGNSNLSNLIGLNNLSFIGGTFYIGDNESLNNITALENLSYVGGSLNIVQNESLSSLSGLEGLSVESIVDLVIAYNSSLSSCEVQSICEYLSSPGGLVIIWNNASGCDSPGEIANSCGLSMPCLPYGNYYITSQTEIDSFQFWYPDCNSLTGYVLIQGDDINNLDGLNHITSVEGVLNIKENPVLIDLDGMDNLSSIEGSLHIRNNPLLLNLLGLSNLTLISDGSLIIRENTSLLSLSGLDNIMVASIDEINIKSNPLLSHCDIESVCKFLANSFGYASINNNASGCNSEEEVEEACDAVSINEQYMNNYITLYPNPANQELNISADGITIDEVSIYTLTGQQALYIRPVNGSVEISHLQPGMYIVEVTVENIKVRQKLLVQR